MTFPGQQFPPPGYPQQPAGQYPPQQFGGFPQAPAQPQAFGGFPQQQVAPPHAAYKPSDPNSFLMGGGVKPAAFPQIGAFVTGVVEDMEMQQQRDLDTNAFLWWDDGRPREQLVVTLRTDQRDPADPLDDGRRRLYVKGGSLPQAIAQACRAAGKPEGMEIGGRLTVQYVGDGEQKKRGYNPPKLYAAQYAAPDPNAAANAALMGGQLEQAPQAPAGVVPFGAPGQQAPAASPFAPAPWAQAPQPQAPAGWPGVDPAAGFAPAQQAPSVQQMMAAGAPATGDPAAAFAQQPAPAAPAVSVPAELPPNVQAALAALPPEQQAAALAQWQAQQAGQQPAA